MRTSTITKMILFAAFVMAVAACKKDETEPIDLVPKLDGLYVYGTNTVAETAIEPEAKMARAILNPDKSGGESNVPGVYGKLMYIGAGSTIKFTEVAAEESTVYGAVGGGEAVAGPELGLTDITADIISGTLVADEDPVAITEEGLYYVFVLMNSHQFRILKVEPEIIGDATEKMWTEGTPLPQVRVSADSAVFEVTDLTLTGASGYKYMFSSGWELYIDDSIATHTHLGVESYADAWDSGINDIGYFGENIPHKVDGIFTVRLKYDASTGGWAETKIKTGAILIDYSAYQMGLFGNAYLTAPGDTANWESGVDGYGLHAPAVDGYVYTWTWDDAELIQDREFIFLENGAWGGLQFDWAMLTSVGGKAVDDGDIVDATTLGGEWHNFYVVNGGAYDISLVIDAKAESKTVTITRSE